MAPRASRLLNVWCTPVYSHIHALIPLAVGYALFQRLVADPVAFLAGALLPVAGLQMSYLALCVPMGGGGGGSNKKTADAKSAAVEGGAGGGASSSVDLARKKALHAPPLGVRGWATFRKRLGVRWLYIYFF
jgi:hypothetical protein